MAEHGVRAGFVGGSGYLGNPFTGRKRWRVVCGECGHGFAASVPVRGPDRKHAHCPVCGVRNEWSLIWFMRERAEHARRKTDGHAG